MAYTPEEAAELLGDRVLPKWDRQQDRVRKIDKWAKWDHDYLVAKQSATTEHRQLQERARTPWGMLVVTAIAQGLFIEGYRQRNESQNSEMWDLWQVNRMDARQSALFRATLTYGDSYTTVVPGVDNLTGEETAVIRAWSPKDMIALYNDPGVDDWPELAARFRGSDDRRQIDVYDDQQMHTFFVDYGSAPEHVDTQEHGLGVVPVVRWLSLPDVNGHADGVIEPVIDIIRRLDQTKYDRLLVQHHSSWRVRTIAGIELPYGTENTEKTRLSQEDILVAEDPDTKFGSLPESPLNPFDQAYDADLRDLSAVTQIPPHYFLAALVNLSAETLAAAQSGMTANRDEHQHSLGEAAEQTLRLAAKAVGNTEAASDYSAQVVWKDTQSRSLAQVADAYGKIAQMLGYPVEMLWDKLPGFTAQDNEAARAKAAEGSMMDQLFQGMLESPDGVNA